MQNQAQQRELTTEFCPTHVAAPVNDSNFATFDVRWLPSMPLLNKRNTPTVAGVGVLYSEDSDQIFHAFETDNLWQSINSCNRQQTSALARDPNCRICWYEIGAGRARVRLLEMLLSRCTSELSVVSA